MGVDGAVRRYFALIVCFCLGLAAYFQASGMTDIVSLVVAPRAATAAPREVRPAVASPPANPAHSTSALPVMERNPFDSKTGSLLGKQSPSEGAEEAQKDGGLCKSVRVVLITASADPEWSFAALAQNGQKTMLRRLGDDIGEYEVAAIGEDRVLLASKAERCVAVLGEKPAAAPPPATSAAPEAGPPKPPKPGDLPPELAAKIRKISENEYSVDRSALESIVQQQGALFGRVRLFPVREGERMTGLRVSGVRSGSLLGVVGVQNGDQLQQVNGYDLANPTAALEAYSKLQTADRLTLTLVRGGKPMNIDVRIQ